MQPLDWDILQVGFDHEGQPKEGEYGTVPAKWEGQKTFKSCEVFAMRKALGRAVLPLTILTSNFGVVQGLGRGDVHCTPDKNPNVDAWTIYQTLSKSEKEVGQDSSW